jgi:lysylphosphatidylglycerol synthetase-like protein (DUF2156 family)
MSNQSRRESFLLPTIADLKSAQAAGRQGTVMCVLIVMTTVMAALAPLTPGQEAGTTEMIIGTMIVLVIYATFAVMIYKMSRVAAILALLVYVGDRLFMIAQQGVSGQSVVAILVVFAFINSIRGTFAYHRFRHQRQEAIQEPDRLPLP